MVEREDVHPHRRGGIVTTLVLWILMNASIAADWGQTRYIAAHPQTFHEEFNPLLGDHPSMRKTNAYFIGALVVNNGIMIALPKKYRPWYAGAVTVIETHFIVSNNQIGIKMQW